MGNGEIFSLFGNTLNNSSNKGVSKEISRNLFILFNKHRLNSEEFMKIKLILKNVLHKYLGMN